MNLSKIKVAIQKIEENEKIIEKAKADRARIQASLEVEQTRVNRIRELQAQRNDVFAEALINSGKPDVSAIDDELRQLERSGKTEPMGIDVASSALAKINQRLVELEANQDALLAAKTLACSESLGAEIDKLAEEIDQGIAALNAAVLRCLALTDVNRKFGAKGWRSIDSFLRDVRLPASVRTPHISVEFSTYLLNNKTVVSHVKSIVDELEKVGAITRAS